MRFSFLQFPRRFTDCPQVFSSFCSIATFGFIFIFSSHVKAADVEAGKFTDMRLRAVMQTRSPKELKEVKEQSERIKIGRIECDIQLKGLRIPSKCFEVLKDESESGLISTSIKRTQEEWLAKLCKKRAQNSNDLRELNRLADLNFLPSSCHEQVIARALDLKYASESENPSSLFIDRFSTAQSTAETTAAELEVSPSQLQLPRPDSGQPAQKLQTTKTVVANRPATARTNEDEP